MPRRLRRIVPGQPLHVVQRGNNRAAMFLARDDFGRFRTCLAESCERFGCLLHAYVFMTNHVHLLVTPLHATAISRVMQTVGRRYVPPFNTAHGRTGGLWEGRFRSVAIDSERYLFTCYRYIELNPVRAGLAVSAAEYPWSSHRANALGAHDELVTPHERYLALGDDQPARLDAYRALFVPALDSLTLDAIRNATRCGWTHGGTVFRAALAATFDANELPPPRRRKRL
jgi:putative transposase